MTTQEAIEYIEQDIMQCVMCDEWEEALKMAVEALQKQIPENPIPDGYKDKCPACGLIVKFGEHYCRGCGQKLRWGE